MLNKKKKKNSFKLNFFFFLSFLSNSFNLFFFILNNNRHFKMFLKKNILKSITLLTFITASFAEKQSNDCDEIKTALKNLNIEDEDIHCSIDNGKIDL